MMETGRRRWAATIVVAALVFLYLPLAVVVLFSFHKTASLTLPFEGLSLRWYQDVFSSPEFRRSVLNSFYVAIAASGVTLILGTLAAYGLSRCSGRFRGPLALLFFLPITLPGLFLGLSLLVFFGRVQLELSLVTVAIAHFVYVFPYFLIIGLATFDRLDPALEENAADLGASPWRAFWTVTVPQIWPVLLGATSLAFALSFDEFVITFFVIGPQSTLPLYIWSGIRRTIDPSINTISTLLMLVTFGLFVIAFLAAGRSERQRRRWLGSSDTSEAA
jgi:ABC-type spermidine/putrescine transport system permease subunit II